MTRSEKITKLANAIREYRGSYVPNSEPRKWIRHPKPGAKERVLQWLERLGVKDKIAAMQSVDGFVNIDDMLAYLTELEDVHHKK